MEDDKEDEKKGSKHHLQKCSYQDGSKKDWKPFILSTGYTTQYFIEVSHKNECYI